MNTPRRRARGALGVLRRRMQRLCGPPRALVLLYHRVAQPEVDPLSLCVAPHRFSGHLGVMRELCQPVSLSDVQSGFVDAHTQIVVTFDDGYADNLDVAAPLASAAGVPVTVFVTTGSLGSQCGFWWDELAAILLLPGDLPEEITLDAGGGNVPLELGHYSRADHARLRTWTVGDRYDPGPRQAAFRRLFALARSFRPSERSMLLSQLRSASASQLHPLAAVLDREEVLRLATTAEIGAHTVSHPVLAHLSPDEQADEIAASKHALEQILGTVVTSFSYPFGGRKDYTHRTVNAVRALGFERACSNYPGGVWASTDRLQLPRILVRDWAADDFRARLERWLLDPAST